MFLKRPYQSIDEFYQSVRELIAVLRANGHEAEASRLDLILHGACTTSSELIGEFMLALADMPGNFPGDVRKRIDDCHYFAKHHRRILGLG